MKAPLPDYCFPPDRYILDVAANRTDCDGCGNNRLHSVRTTERRPVGIMLGRPLLRHHIKKCPACGREYGYEHMDQLVPPCANYAYDVIAEVGLGRFSNCLQNREIKKDIQKRFRLSLPESSIKEMADAFLDCFAAAHYGKVDNLREIIDGQGGYVGHFDGTCEAGTDILFTVIDEISDMVLSTSRMMTENVEDIKRLLERCRELFGVPLATMRDLSRNIALARSEVFEDTPDLICQYHFLENVGKALFKETHRDLTRQLRMVKIRPRLKSLRKNLSSRMKEKSPISEKAINEFIKSTDGRFQFDRDQARKHLTKYIFEWLEDYCSELKGEYFPFDQPNLVCRLLLDNKYDSLEELLANSTSFKAREKQTLESIARVLKPVKNDEALVSTAQRLEKSVKVFEELRDILRFKRKDGKPVLRQRPPYSTKKYVGETEERLDKFSRKLKKRINTESSGGDPDIINNSKILIKYLDKYSEKLVGHLITLPKKNQQILLDRTNNVSEQCFSVTKKRWRRKLGTKKLTRHLQAARHEEFFVANLEQQNYIDAIYDGSIDNMPFIFAKYGDKAFEIRKSRKLSEDKRTFPISKKSLREPGKLLKVVSVIGGLLSYPN